MNSKREGLLSALLSERGTLTELLVVGGLLAIGINLISSALPEVFRWLAITTGTVGCILIAIALFLLLTKLYRQLDYDRTIKGFFILDRKMNELVDVPRYDYAHDVFRFLKSAFAENPALRNLWDKDRLSGAFQFDQATGGMKYHSTEAGRLLREATEYYVLNNLSTHLTDYFNQDRFRPDELRTFLRNDVPDVLLRNRFMDLFTRPLEDRAPFVDRSVAHNRMHVVAVYGPNGAFYDRFDLVLPTHARVERVAEHGVRICTNRLNFTFTVVFDHAAGVLPREFQKRHLGINEIDRYATYHVEVDVRVSFRFGSLLTRKGWEYYRWVDSFISGLESDMAQDDYFERIGWQAALTVLEAIERGNVQPNGNRPDAPDSGAPRTMLN